MFKQLKNILPISKRHFNDTMGEILKALANINKEISNVEERVKKTASELVKQDVLLKTYDQKLAEISEISKKTEAVAEVLKEHIFRFDQIDQNLKEIYASQNNGIKHAEKYLEELAAQKQLVKDVSKKIDLTTRTINEILWAHVFNNTITESEWLKSKSFSPGRWAAGYDYLYVLYRALNAASPEHILELGLGQSTKMISQYASWKNAQHEVVEHDANWISFFSTDFSLPEQTQVVHLELTEKPFLDDEKVLVYQDFQKTFEGKKYDFIAIDAPFGGQANIYARIDIIDLLPECLNDSFVILIDDYNRKGEQRTVEVIEKKLTDCSIQFSSGVYYGAKYLYVITSENLSFLCTV